MQVIYRYEEGVIEFWTGAKWHTARTLAKTFASRAVAERACATLVRKSPDLVPYLERA